MAKEKKKARGKGKKSREKVREEPRPAASRDAIAEGVVWPLREEDPAPRAEGFTLEQAAALLGPGDGALEQALRQGHQDEELEAEGARVPSERILADGERLCSLALGYLLDPEPGMQLALRKAGLTRPLLALTVDVLRRLKEAEASDPAVLDLPALTVAQATARGRRLREEMLGRLRLLERADAQLARALVPLAARPATAERLASQLEGLAALVRGLDQHARGEVRALAASKSLGPEDAEELDAAAEALHSALARGASADPTRRPTREAVLDVLDGLCLLLLGDLQHALRAAHHRNPRVAAPPSAVAGVPGRASL